MGGNDLGQIQVLAVDGAAAVPAVGSEGVYISSGAGHGVSVHHFHGGLAHVACDEVKHFLPQQWGLVGKLNHVACIGEGMDGFVAQLSVGGVRFFKGFIGREWGLFGYALFYRGRNGKASRFPLANPPSRAASPIGVVPEGFFVEGHRVLHPQLVFLIVHGGG